MEYLPKDVLIHMALDFDLFELLNFCRSSNRINALVCNDKDKTIWYHRLRQDYDIYNIPKPYDAKSYYKYIYTQLNGDLSKKRGYLDLIFSKFRSYLTNVDNALINGVTDNNIDLVRLALDNGANININGGIALKIAMEKDYSDIVNYLIQRGAFDFSDRENRDVIGYLYSNKWN